MAEGEETYRIDTFGRIFGITRQALVNDDVGAFTDLSRRLGQAAAAFEAQFLVDLLVQGSGLGPLMKDGSAYSTPFMATSQAPARHRARPR